MNRVIIIGPTNVNTVIYAKEKYKEESCINSEIESRGFGGSFLIAYDAACLGCDTYFVSRLSYDDVADKMIYELEKVNCAYYSAHKTLAHTPTRIIIVNENKKLTFYDDLTYDVYPASEDTLPAIVTDTGDYGIVNLINSTYLNNILNTYPKVKWIANNFVPSNQFLPYIEGIILDYDQLKYINLDKDFELNAMNLIDRGIKWIIVAKHGIAATLYTIDGKQHYEKDSEGDYFIGCYEVFVSMLSACLSNSMNMDESIDHALNLANDFSNIKDVSLKVSDFNSK